MVSPRLSWFGDGRSCSARVIRRSCPRRRLLFQQPVVRGVDPRDPGGGAGHDLGRQPLGDQHVGVVLTHQPVIGTANLVDRGAGGDADLKRRLRADQGCELLHWTAVTHCTAQPQILCDSAPIRAVAAGEPPRRVSSLRWGFALP